MQLPVTKQDVMLDEFLDDAKIEYTITVIDSDGDVLAYISGCDYEDLAEQSLPEFQGQNVYELTATVNGEDVPAKRTSFSEIGCLEKFEQIEVATIEFATDLFMETIEQDFDSAAKDMELC